MDRDNYDPEDVDVLNKITDDRHIPSQVKSSCSTVSCNLFDNNLAIETHSAEKVAASLIVLKLSWWEEVIRNIDVIRTFGGLRKI